MGGCKGVDPNRNWGYHFGEAGVSYDKCSEVYCGETAFSEVETANIRDFVQTLDPVQSWAGVSTPTPSCGCGPMDMHMMHTQTTGKRSNNWQRTLVTLSIRCMGLFLILSTLLNFTPLLEPLMTGTSPLE